MFFLHKHDTGLEQLYAGHALPQKPAHSQRAEENRGGDKRMAPNRKIQPARRRTILRFPMVWVGISDHEILGPSLNFCLRVDIFNGHGLVWLSCIFGQEGEVQ